MTFNYRYYFVIALLLEVLVLSNSALASFPSSCEGGLNNVGLVNAKTIVRNRAEPPRIEVAAPSLIDLNQVEAAYRARLYTNLALHYKGTPKVLAEGGESVVLEMDNRPNEIILYPKNVADIYRMQSAYQLAAKISKLVEATAAAPYLNKVLRLETSLSGLEHHLIIEKAEKGSLAQVIKLGSDISLVGTRADARQQLLALRGVALGLKTLHELGYVHGDINPANLLVRSDGRMEIGDLGSIHALDRPPVLGTARTALYSDPERMQGGPASVKSDVVAFSRVAFEVILGKRLGDKENEIPVPLETVGTVTKIARLPSPKSQDDRVKPILNEVSVALEGIAEGSSPNMDKVLETIDRALNRLSN